jgi:hypothetical protein
VLCQSCLSPLINSLTGAAHSTAPGLERDIASFARHLRAANLSPKTIQTYLEANGQLVRFLAETGLPAAGSRGPWPTGPGL